jgi:pilus assembly protein Flp/PilA
MARLFSKLSAFAHDESAATSIEYALIASIMLLALVVTIPQIKGTLNTVFTNVATSLNTASAN